MKLNQPTRGASESSNAWTSSPRAAKAVRIIIFIGPLAASLAVVLLMGPLLWRPPGFSGLIIWIIQAMTVGFLVSGFTDRAMRRFVPLAGLLQLTLVFPDEAPSRFGTALRSGTLRQRQNRLTELAENGLSDDTNTAAVEAVEMVGLLTSHDPRTRGHTERVRAYADLIATELGIDQASRDRLAWSVMLHDVGKLSVPPEILNKETKLEDDEWEILKGHPAAGQAMLAPLSEWLGEWDGAAGEHHERWDGGGYPLGLRGTQISLAGRITAVADAYDVITSTRSYKSPMTNEAARRELVRCSGTQFDPEVVRAMLTVSLAHQRKAGPFAWLADSPRLLDALQGVATAPAVAVLTVAAATGGTFATLAPETVIVPPEVAFSEASTVTQTPTTQAPPANTSTSTTQANSDLPSPTTTTTTIQPSSTTEPTDTESTTTTSTTAQPTTSLDTGAVVPTTTTSAPTTTTTTSAIPSTTPPARPSTTTTTRPTTTTTRPTTTTTTTVPTTTTTTAPTTTTTTVPTTTTTMATGPFAEDDTFEIEQGMDRKIEVADNDTPRDFPIDKSSLSIVTPPQHAASFRIHDAGGTYHLHYKSERNYEGIDTLEYSICDTSGACSIATLTITVTD